MEYHVATFCGIVGLYWAVKALMRKCRTWRKVVVPELLSQCLFLMIYLFFGIRYQWNIFLHLAPAAGLWVAYLCYAIGEAIALRAENRRAYLIGLGVYGVAPLLVLLLPPIGVLH